MPLARPGRGAQHAAARRAQRPRLGGGDDGRAALPLPRPPLAHVHDAALALRRHRVARPPLARARLRVRLRAVRRVRHRHAADARGGAALGAALRLRGRLRAGLARGAPQAVARDAQRRRAALPVGSARAAPALPRQARLHRRRLPALRRRGDAHPARRRRRVDARRCEPARLPRDGAARRERRQRLRRRGEPVRRARVGGGRRHAAVPLPEAAQADGVRERQLRHAARAHPPPRGHHRQDHRQDQGQRLADADGLAHVHAPRAGEGQEHGQHARPVGARGDGPAHAVDAARRQARLRPQGLLAAVRALHGLAQCSHPDGRLVAQLRRHPAPRRGQVGRRRAAAAHAVARARPAVRAGVPKVQARQERRLLCLQGQGRQGDAGGGGRLPARAAAVLPAGDGLQPSVALPAAHRGAYAADARAAPPAPHLAHAAPPRPRPADVERARKLPRHDRPVGRPRWQGDRALADRSAQLHRARREQPAG
mmetsp:Transcript_40879/g.132934  ORF Transcript_40879/g.132934 Transcript_40879/m.132934 type:complete len:483 (+) Transcript_40879:452-1900(+)